MIEILKVQEIVREAAKIFSNRNAAEQIKQKGVFDYVTAIDEAVQEFIQKELSDLYPQIQFMGEEKLSPNNSPFCMDTNRVLFPHKSSLIISTFPESKIPTASTFSSKVIMY